MFILMIASLLTMNVCCGSMKQMHSVDSTAQPVRTVNLLTKQVFAIPENSRSAVEEWERAQHSRRLASLNRSIIFLENKRKICENILYKIRTLISIDKSQEYNERLRLNIDLCIYLVRTVILYNISIQTALSNQSQCHLSIYKAVQKQMHHVHKTQVHQIRDAIMQYLERKQSYVLLTDKTRMESLLNDMRDTFAEMHNLRYTESTDIDLNQYVDTVSCFEMLRKLMIFRGFNA